MKEYTKSELLAAIDEYIVGKYAERDRILLRYKLIDGLSYNQIANRLSADDNIPPEYKIETRQIQRAIQRSLKTLFRHI